MLYSDNTQRIYQESRIIKIYQGLNFIPKYDPIFPQLKILMNFMQQKCLGGGKKTDGLFLILRLLLIKKT